MSLINKVLKDLEARERASRETSERPLLGDLRAAPTSASKFSSMGLAGAVFVAGLLCIAGAAGWYWYGMRPAPRALAGPPMLPRLSTPLPQRPAAPVVTSSVASASTDKPLTTPKKAAFELLPGTPKPLPSKVPVRPTHSPARLPHKAILHPQHTRHSYRSAGLVLRRRAPMTAAQHSQTRYRQAIAALQQGRSQEARSDLKEALSLDPQDLRPRLLLSALDVQGGHLKAAHALLAQGLLYHPHALSVALLLAQVDLREGRPESAVRVLSKLSQDASQSEPYWALLAASQMRANDTAGAIMTYHQALQRFARNGTLWVGLGLAELDGKHKGAARKAFLQAQKCVLSPVLAQYVEGELKRLP